ncbi:MAG: cell shape determination protein CcmA [Gammaproteobacteria bacterium HGW-Gammaproteobacteria-1]|jgi:cytoskeletal protein CcmA (bactofilin family)|nr:MAG: cell shape determination protein CcmA [Gammaproteobacteria bacterium HGW-Gammaproteobacteria-1]
MFGKTKSTTKSAKIDTLIGQNTEIRGDVVFSGGLHVDGTLKGNVIADQDSGSVLSVSERGLVEGDVRVPNVVLNGCVVGDVYASNHIELAPQARVKGNVYYKIIEMARGAEVNGNLVHRGEGAVDTPAPAQPLAAREPALGDS